MSIDPNRSGGTRLHHTAGVPSRTAPIHIYAGTVPQRPVAATNPAAQRRKVPWVVYLIVGMFVLAGLILAVTVATISSSRRQKAAIAEARQALESARLATHAVWSQELEPVFAGISVRASATVARTEALLARAPLVAGPQRESILAEATRFAALATSLTGRLASCGLAASRILAQSAAADSLLSADQEREKMGRVAGTLAEYVTYVQRFEGSIEALEKRMGPAAGAPAPRPSGTPLSTADSIAAPPASAAPPTAAVLPVPAPAPLDAAPPSPPSAPPNPAAARLASLETEYALAMTNHAFSAVAEKIGKELEAGSFSSDATRRLKSLAEGAALLDHVKAFLVARLSRAPLPRGWIADAAPVDILSADASALTLRGRVVPWAEVPQRQMMHLMHQSIPGAALTGPAKSRLLLGSAVYLGAHGQGELALRYRTEAVAMDASAQEIAERVLPDLRTMYRQAAESSVARAREELDRVDQAAADVQRSLIGEITPGSASMALYRNIPGGKPDDLRKSAKFPDNPDSREPLTKLQVDKGRGENFGAVVSGFLLAPATGEYHFYVTVDDSAELWLGTGPLPASKRRIIYVDKTTPYDKWTDQESQKSGPIALVGNRPYYLELVYKQGTATDFVRVGWKYPGVDSIRVVDGPFLAPVPASFLAVDPSSLAAKAASGAMDSLSETDGLLQSARESLAAADASCRMILAAAGNTTAEDAAIREVAASVRKSQLTLRETEQVLAKAREQARQAAQAQATRRF